MDSTTAPGYPKVLSESPRAPACIRPHEPENSATSGSSSGEESGLKTEASHDALRQGTHPSSSCMDRGKEKTFPTLLRVSLVTVYI